MRLFKVIPQHSTAHPYCTRFSRQKSELDSEINARFLSNEHGDLYFLLHNFAVQIIAFKVKQINKKIVRKEKKISLKDCTAKTVTAGCEL